MNVHFAAYLPDLQWIVINADGTFATEEGQMDADHLRTMLLGTPEQVRSPWDASVFVRTEGMLPVNWLATMLLRQSLSPGQQVRGPMVVLGPADAGGEVTTAEPDLITAVVDAAAHIRDSK